MIIYIGPDNGRKDANCLQELNTYCLVQLYAYTNIQKITSEYLEANSYKLGYGEALHQILNKCDLHNDVYPICMV